MNKNYYLVEAMCGHVGRGSYIPVLFPIKAENGKEAAKIARLMPRVKHHHKNAILNVQQVSYEEFIKQCEINSNDSYLQWRTMKYDENYDYVSVIQRIVNLSNVNDKTKNKDQDKRKKPRREAMNILNTINNQLLEMYY